ncbi:MAG: hypothetical protein JW953_20970 [Anaerolineae bacterium]|nr:hypothetical protein [Anaerolineae bacterium]
MPPALWLIIVPLAAVPVVYLLRRTGLGAVVAAGVALFSAWLAWRLPPGLVANILGRPIELDQLSQTTLAILFAAGAVLFLIALPISPPENQIALKREPGRGRTFHPVGLATLAIFVAASLSGHLGITAILIEVAVIFAVFIIQGRRLESTRAAQRFLVMLSLAVPLFLLAAWRIDRYQLSGGAQLAGYLQQTTLLVGLGFALWLAVFPGHGWLTAVAAEANPPAAAFVLIAFPLAAFSTLIELLANFPWLVTSSPLAWAMIVAGIVTALAGGLLAAVQRSFSALLGYAALYDLGCALAGLGAGGQAAVITILAGLIVRTLALTLNAACLVALQRHAAHDGFAQVTGLARRLPVTTAGLIIGGLTLAGGPLTIGFPLRWQLLQATAGVDSRWPVLLALAGLGVAMGYWRGLKFLLPQPKKRPSKLSSRVALSLQEPVLLLILIGLLASACILLGLFPWLLVEPLQELSRGITIPIR